MSDDLPIDCQCAAAGWCERRKANVAELHWRKCQAGNVETIDRLYADLPKKMESLRREKREGSTPELPAMSDVGTNLINAFEYAMGVTISCGSCRAFFKSLNYSWKHDRELVTAKVYAEMPIPIPLRQKLGTKEAVRAWIAEIVNSIIPHDDHAIIPKIRRSPYGHPPYTSWRSEADGPAAVFGPFVSEIRHLTYFVYARTEESWHWNLEQLAKRWWLFNGKKILGIAHDEETATPETVIAFAESLGMTFTHHVIKKNVPNLREVVAFPDMLRILNPPAATDREVVFSAHAKGQKYDDPKHTRDWCDLMYQSCLDDWPAVYNALRTALFAGSFREYGLLGKRRNWAYSGSFYWWRLAELGKRNWREVDPWFAGTESWPGKMCEARETACLFLNDSRRLYDPHYWTSTVWPEWAKYLEQRNRP